MSGLVVQENAWTVTNNNGSICLWVQVALHLTLPYMKKGSNESAMYEFDFNDTLATVDKAKSSCSMNKSVLALTSTSKDVSALKMVFVNINEVSKLQEIEVMFDPKTYPNTTEKGTKTASGMPDKNLGNAMNTYTCKAKQSVKLNRADIAKMEGSVALTEATIQAFNFKGKKPNEVTNECDADIPLPTIPAAPAKDHFSLKDKTNNKTCIILDGSFMLELPYKTNDGKNATVYLNIAQNNTKVEDMSTCNGTNGTQLMFLSFLNKAKPGVRFEVDPPPYMMTLLFTKKDDKFSISGIGVHYTYDPKYFPDLEKSLNGTTRDVMTNKTYFEAPTKNSYLCDSNQTIPIADGVKLSVANFRYQAFRQGPDADKDDSFSSAVQCNLDDNTSDIVPIAVGCALAGLVLIVLIAYVIGRRRTNRGYQTV